MISSHLWGTKQFLVRLNSSTNCLVCVTITFRGLTMFVFNFGVGSLEQSVKLGQLVIVDFLGNSLLWTPLFPNRQPNSSAFYSVFVVWAVFQLRWRKKTYLKRRPLFRSQIFLRHPRLAFDWLSVNFFDYWPIRMSDLLLSFHWINPLRHWITWNCIYLN